MTMTFHYGSRVSDELATGWGVRLSRWVYGLDGDNIRNVLSDEINDLAWMWLR